MKTLHFLPTSYHHLPPGYAHLNLGRETGRMWIIKKREECLFLSGKREDLQIIGHMEWIKLWLNLLIK